MEEHGDDHEAHAEIEKVDRNRRLVHRRAKREEKIAADPHAEAEKEGERGIEPAKGSQRGPGADEQEENPGHAGEPEAPEQKAATQ
jgi:hypothetical protein